MLEILTLIFVARYFNKYAKDHHLNAVLWSVLSVVSFIIGALIIILGILLASPDMFDNMIVLSLLEIPAGLVGVFIAYLIMKGQAGNKASTQEADVLDDELSA